MRRGGPIDQIQSRPVERAAAEPGPTEARSQGRPKAAAQRCEASWTASVGLVRARPPTAPTETAG